MSDLNKHRANDPGQSTSCIHKSPSDARTTLDRQKADRVFKKPNRPQVRNGQAADMIECSRTDGGHQANVTEDVQTNVMLHNQLEDTTEELPSAQRRDGHTEQVTKPKHSNGAIQVGCFGEIINNLQTLPSRATSKAEIEAVLERVTSVQLSLYKLLERDDLVSDLFEPEKSELDIPDFASFFRSQFNEAVNKLSCEVSAKMAPIGSLSDRQKMDLLVELRTLKNKLSNGLVRLRYGTMFQTGTKSTNLPGASYSDLSTIGIVSKTNLQSFADISKAVLGQHYATLSKRSRIVYVRSELHYQTISWYSRLWLPQEWFSRVVN